VAGTPVRLPIATRFLSWDWAKKLREKKNTIKKRRNTLLPLYASCGEY